VTINKRLDLGDDPDHDWNPGIFKGNFATAAYMVSCENVAGSAALEEGCNFAAFECF